MNKLHMAVSKGRARIAALSLSTALTGCATMETTKIAVDSIMKDDTNNICIIHKNGCASNASNPGISYPLPDDWREESMVFKAKNCHQIPGCIPINENDRDVTEATIRKFTVRNKDNMQRSYKIAGERALANANKECNEGDASACFRLPELGRTIKAENSPLRISNNGFSLSSSSPDTEARIGVEHQKSSGITTSFLASTELIKDSFAVAILAKLGEEGYEATLGSTIQVINNEYGIVSISGTATIKGMDQEFIWNLEGFTRKIEKRIVTNSGSFILSWDAKTQNSLRIKSAKLNIFESKTKNPGIHESWETTLQMDENNWNHSIYEIYAYGKKLKSIEAEVGFDINRYITGGFIIGHSTIYGKSLDTEEKDGKRIIGAFAKYGNGGNSGEFRVGSDVTGNFIIGNIETCVGNGTYAGIGAFKKGGKAGSEKDYGVMFHIRKELGNGVSECEKYNEMPYNEVEAKIIYNTPRPRETVAEAVKNASFRTQTLTGQDQRVKTEIISLSIQNLSLSCEVGKTCPIDLLNAIQAKGGNFTIKIINNGDLSGINNGDTGSSYNVISNKIGKHIIAFEVMDTNNPEIRKTGQIEVNVGIDTSALTILITSANGAMAYASSTETEAQNKIKDNKYTQASRGVLENALEAYKDAKTALQKGIDKANLLLSQGEITLEEYNNRVKALQENYNNYAKKLNELKDAINALDEANRAPYGNDLNIKGTSGQTFTHQITGVVDPDGDHITYGLEDGSISVTGGTASISITPEGKIMVIYINGNPEIIGVFTYNDGKGGTGKSYFIITGLSYTPVSVNEPPKPTFENFNTNQNTSYNGILTATDHENDPLTFGKIKDPIHGTLTIDSKGKFVYTPNSGYVGGDSFEYSVYDGKNVVFKVVNISVTATTPPVTPPSISVVNQTCTESTSCSITLGGGTDVKEIVVTESTVPWVPKGTYQGSSETFNTQNVNLSDGGTYTYYYTNSGGNSGTETGTLTVTPTLQAPIFGGIVGNTTYNPGNNIEITRLVTSSSGPYSCIPEGTLPVGTNLKTEANGCKLEGVAGAANFYEAAFKAVLNADASKYASGTIQYTVEEATPTIDLPSTIQVNCNVGDTKDLGLPTIPTGVTLSLENITIGNLTSDGKFECKASGNQTGKLLAMYNGVKLDETDISINSTNATQPMPTISIINQDNNNIDNVTISGNTIEVYISGANKTRITIELSSGNFTKGGNDSTLNYNIEGGETGTDKVEEIKVYNDNIYLGDITLISHRY